MNSELSFETAVCSEYETLLHECQRALECWHERRREIRQARVTGVNAGSELLTLQAHYAKAYNLLRKHSEKCERCQFASQAASRRSGKTG